ncbi:hypothetical protein AR158_c815L [Paramecium bursaria Chlorella virus AR158]|uniref:hypothetical protein n=1 Tax=Paramecium bursaria Chlorella virus AR158 TaxID=380598 RepID=UPI00015AA933|nr:hypothetical protein AR158_c815L [Paramecium bursaria Chlorella virus AR158]ABU44360.1 hypothetical protein AR158_c815L [Paramecium bursaria Chlorella virus AR158]
MVYGKSLRSPRCHLPLREAHLSLHVVYKVIYNLEKSLSIRSIWSCIDKFLFDGIRQITKVASVSSAIGTLSEPHTANR